MQGYNRLAVISDHEYVPIFGANPAWSPAKEVAGKPDCVVCSNPVQYTGDKCLCVTCVEPLVGRKCMNGHCREYGATSRGYFVKRADGYTYRVFAKSDPIQHGSKLVCGACLRTEAKRLPRKSKRRRDSCAADLVANESPLTAEELRCLIGEYKGTEHESLLVEWLVSRGYDPEKYM